MANSSNYALRLQTSILDEVRQVVREEGTSINQFINTAIVEKLSAMRTARYLRERANCPTHQEFMQLLDRIGTDEVIEGDELPEDWEVDSIAMVA